jgi:hypothetical protein
MAIIYSHPHVATTIESVENIPSLSQGLTTVFSAFVADKGEDRKMKLITSQSEFLNEYFENGKIDISKHGQAALNTWRWLANGKAYCLAVTNDDTISNNGLNGAAYANAIYGIGLKKTNEDVTVDELDEATNLTVQKTYKKIEVKNRIKNIPSVGSSSFNEMIGYQSNPDGTEFTMNIDNGDNVDSDGFKWFDIFLVYYKGRSEYGNKKAIRISEATQYKTLNPDDVIYTFEIISKSDGYDEIQRSYFVSVNPEARTYSKESLYISDLLGAYEEDLRVYSNPTFLTAVEEYMGGSFNASLMSINKPVIWGYSKLDEFRKNGYIIQTSVTENGVTTIHSDRYDTSHENKNNKFDTSILLKGGTKGLMTKPIVNQLLENAYYGFVDSLILDTELCEIDVIIDANEAASVKTAMEQLAINRGDCVYISDLGFSRTFKEALDKRLRTYTSATEHTAYFGQDLVVDDPFFSRNIRVTSTYLLSDIIPRNDTKYSISKNFVGARRGIINGTAIDGYSWFPTEPQREELYLNQVNYIIYDGEVYFDSQLTSRRDGTALSNLSVSRAIMRMRRLAKKAAKYTKHEYFTEDTYREVKKAIFNNLKSFIEDGSVETMRIDVYASKYDKIQKLLRVKIIVKFTDIIERILISFAISR